jgi:hypothetical protein
MSTVSKQNGKDLLGMAVSPGICKTLSSEVALRVEPHSPNLMDKGLQTMNTQYKVKTVLV